MKQIYKILDIIGDHYNNFIFIIFNISIIILILNNSDYSIWKYYDTQKEYEIGNGIWNNILTGLIGSAIFYWLVQYLPERRKQKRIVSNIQKNIYLIRGSIVYFVDVFLRNYDIGEINNFKEEDLLNLKRFNSSNNSVNVKEIIVLVELAETIEKQLNIINSTNAINTLDFYTSSFINMYYKIPFSTNIPLYKLFIEEYNKEGKYNKSYEKMILLNRGRNLNDLYKYSQLLNDYILTSSSSKQSS